MIEEELAFARSALQQALEFLPENALVGFVSFGTQVQVHELGYADMSKVYVFRGSKEMTKDQVLDQLGLGSGAGGRRVGGAPGQGFQKGVVQGGGFPNSGVSRFLLPASEGAYIIHSVSSTTILVQNCTISLLYITNPSVNNLKLSFWKN